jgi:hypothetical protein
MRQELILLKYILPTQLSANIAYAREEIWVTALKAFLQWQFGLA